MLKNVLLFDSTLQGFTKISFNLISAAIYQTLVICCRKTLVRQNK